MFTSVVSGHQFRDCLRSKAAAKIPHRSIAGLNGGNFRLQQPRPLDETLELSQGWRDECRFVRVRVYSVYCPAK
jgi:hypothetical protein